MDDRRQPSFAYVVVAGLVEEEGDVSPIREWENDFDVLVPRQEGEGEGVLLESEQGVLRVPTKP